MSKNEDWGDSDDDGGNETLARILREQKQKRISTQLPDSTPQPPSEEAKAKNRASIILEKQASRFKGLEDIIGEGSDEELLHSIQITDAESDIFLKQKFKDLLIDEKHSMDKVDPLEQIDRNERKANINPDQLIHEHSKMLDQNIDMERIKNNILKVDQLGTLCELLDTERSQVLCIKTLGQYLFAGDTEGQVKVYDMLNTQINKPTRMYAHQEVRRSPVSCIDFSIQPKSLKGTQYLLIGYQSGAVAIWDMTTNKMDKFITEIHQSEVVSVKCLTYEPDTENLWLISAEKKGPVYDTLVKTKKKYLIRDTSDKQTVYNKKLKAPVSIAVFQPETPEQRNSYWGQQNLAALGAYNYVIVCKLGFPKDELKTIKRPTNINSDSVPYLDFGYGRTPGKQDVVSPLLCVAWDNFVQLIYFDEENHSVEIDGLYLTEYQISSVMFTSESVLTILEDQVGLKQLYTRKFQVGEYDSYLDEQEMQKILDQSRNAELRIGQKTRPEYQLGAPRLYPVKLKQNLTAYNNNKSICKSGRVLYFLHEETISRVIVLTLNEFISQVKAQTDVTWLNKLKLLLLMYRNCQIGFAEMPDDEGFAERFLAESLNQLLVNFLKYNFKKFTRDTPPTESQVERDNNVVKCAIELSLMLQDMNLLFDKVLTIFQEQGRETLFMDVLYHQITCGLFQGVALPDFIISTMIKIGDSVSFEKLVMNMNLLNYANEIQNLESLCVKYKKYGAIFHINMQMLNWQVDKANVEVSCLKTLQTLYTCMLEARQAESGVKERLAQHLLGAMVFAKQDLKLLEMCETSKRQKIEQSYVYLGYKILWMIQMLLEGKKFPRGLLNAQQHKLYVRDILEFIQQEDNFKAMINFDAKTVFKVISLLFKGKAWGFLQEISAEPTKLIREFRDRIKSITQDSSKSDRILISYYTFVLQILTQQKKDQSGIQLDQPVVIKAILNAVKPNSWGLKQTYQIEEELIIKAIKARSLSDAEIKQIFLILETNTYRNQSQNIFVELHQKREDYANAFRCLLNEKSRHAEIYTWLSNMKQKLINDSAKYEDLKQSLRVNLRDIVEYEVNQNIQQTTKKNLRGAQSLMRQAGNIVKDTLKNELYCKNTIRILGQFFANEPELLVRLGLDELEQKPELQLHFLKSFIVMENQLIVRTLEDNLDQAKNDHIAKLYNKMLAIFILRLCDHEQHNVEAWVSQDYFPIEECMRVCQDRKNYLGLALIMHRQNDGKEAIRNYVLYMREIEFSRFYDQLNLLSLDGDQFGKLNHFDHLGKFDTTLDKAAKVAETPLKHDATKPKYGEEAWLAILEFLHEFQTDGIRRLPEVVYRRSPGMNAQQRASEVEKKEEKLKIFIQHRFQNILQRDCMNVSFQQISERLNLQIQDIEVYSRYQLDQLKLNQRRAGALCRIQEIDIYDMFEDHIHYISYGAAIYTEQDEEGVYHSEQECSNVNCSRKQIFDSDDDELLPIDVFGCGHVYHMGCSDNLDSCLACLKQQIRFDQDEDSETQESSTAGGKEDEQDIWTTKKREITQDQRNRALLRSLQQQDQKIFDNTNYLDDFNQ